MNRMFIALRTMQEVVLSDYAAKDNIVLFQKIRPIPIFANNAGRNDMLSVGSVMDERASSSRETVLHGNYFAFEI